MIFLCDVDDAHDVERGNLDKTGGCGIDTQENGVDGQGMSGGRRNDEREGGRSRASEERDMEEQEASDMEELEGADSMAAVIDPHMMPDGSKPMRVLNAAVPVGVMLVGMVAGILTSGAAAYYEGHADQQPDVPMPSMVEILSNAETSKVLIWSSLSANLVAMCLALVQRLLTVEECMEAWIAGMRSVTVGLMTLLFAWGVGNMSQVLHVGPFMGMRLFVMRLFVKTIHEMRALDVYRG